MPKKIGREDFDPNILERQIIKAKLENEAERKVERVDFKKLLANAKKIFESFLVNKLTHAKGPLKLEISEDALIDTLNLSKTDKKIAVAILDAILNKEVGFKKTERGYSLENEDLVREYFGPGFRLKLAKKFFNSHPNMEINSKMLAQELKISPASATHILVKLFKEGFLIRYIDDSAPRPGLSEHFYKKSVK